MPLSAGNHFVTQNLHVNSCGLRSNAGILPRAAAAGAPAMSGSSFRKNPGPRHDRDKAAAAAVEVSYGAVQGRADGECGMMPSDALDRLCPIDMLRCNGKENA